MLFVNILLAVMLTTIYAVALNKSSVICATMCKLYQCEISLKDRYIVIPFCQIMSQLQYVYLCITDKDFLEEEVNTEINIHKALLKTLSSLEDKK